MSCDDCNDEIVVSEDVNIIEVIDDEDIIDLGSAEDIISVDCDDAPDVVFIENDNDIVVITEDSDDEIIVEESGDIVLVSECEPGPAGPPGVILWSNITEYSTGDVVFYDGAFYEALQDSTGDQPDISPLFWVAVTSGGGGAVDSVNSGTNITVDNTDPANPIINLDALDASDVGADPAGSASTAESNANAYTDTEIGNIDYPVDSVNGQTDVVVLDTDDIADTATNRYTNDTDISRLANTSGSNSGDQDLSGKQDLLVSGTNIKTVNGSSVLGTGDITISGGSSLIIDTKRNILTSTPVSPSVALSNDTKEYFAYDGTNWNKASLKFNTDSPAPDMGYIQGNDKNGYGNEYIDNKRFTNLAIGQFNEQPYEGAIRYDMSQTPPAFELYARGIWNKIFYDFQMLNGKLEHIPKRYTIAVASGHSTEKGLNGLPYIRGYSVDMGAYPRTVIIDGGQLGT